MHASKQVTCLVFLSSVFLSCLLPACKTRQTKTPGLGGLPKSKLNSANSLQDFAVGSIKARNVVSGPKLQTKDLQVSLEVQDEHKSLSIQVIPDPEADFLQFAICSIDDQSICDPDKEQPLTFAAEQHTYPVSLVGKVNVFVRSCVAPARATNYLMPCGPWEQRLYNQPKVSDETLHQTLVSAYKSSQAILAECEKIRSVLDEYRLKNPGSKSQFDTLVENYRNQIPPQSCKELIMSDSWKPLEEAVTDENKKQSKDTGKDTGSVVMLSLGSPALVLGFAAAGVGIYKWVKNDFPTANKSTQVDSTTDAAPADTTSTTKNKVLSETFDNKTFYRSLAVGGTLSLVVGAILVGVSGFGLDTVTISDQQEVREKLNEIYARIAALRPSATLQSKAPATL